ncbi:hypothetical protein L218DRAFT_1074888 [Marasmius fiardii PR-910]|nr:hypothetical protein L218DRAFT_1074888 [Marasmius fiardii PR-910]
MSARTPFIPSGSRPASRLTHTNNDQSVDSVVQPARNAQFAPEVNNPLRQSDLSSKAYKGPPGAVPDPKETVVNKPLNLKGLSKKNTALVPNSSPDSTRQLQPNTSRSRRDNPTMAMDNQNAENSLNLRRESSMNLITPVPRLANQSTPPVFARINSPETFKTSTSFSSNQASLEPEHFKLNLSMSKGAGVPPQRVPIEENLSLPGLMPSRNRSKRTRPDEEEEEDPDLVYLGSTGLAGGAAAQVAKRYKPHGQQLDHSTEMDYMRPSFSPQPFSSPVSHPRALGSDYNASPKGPANGFYRQQTGIVEGRGHSGGSSSQDYGKSHGNGSTTGGEMNSLDRLLGCQTSVYLDEHMARYQELSNKWQECTMEEWVKGSEEIMAKYIKVLDFVKKHMESKLKLLASFDTQIDDHKTVLKERDRVLDGVKQKLLSNGQNMLASGSSGS